MLIYFVRHGQSTANTEEIIWTKDEGHPLTAEGRSQAEKLAELLSGEIFSNIYCSPIQRAKETAEIVAVRMGKTITVRDGLREIGMGEIEGQSTEEAWQRHHAVYHTWVTGEDLNARIPGGESFYDARSRFTAEVEHLCSSDTDSKVLVVSHGGVLGSMLPSLLTNVPDDYGYYHLLDNTGCILTEKREDGLFCLKWQDESFS
jgi:broad specificity phosphatase PhoE